jgi:peptide chain release factor subunit 1
VPAVNVASGLLKDTGVTQVPTTTIDSPDQRTLRALMRRLADVESPEAPVLSICLDVRPEAHGERPGRRVELVVMRDRLRDITTTYPAHDPARMSLDADIERIERFLEDEPLDGVDGLAIFACHGTDLWETIEAPVPFETQVSAGPTADLFQLAQLLEESEAVVVALVDTNTCRLFVTRRGSLVERPGPDEPPDEHERHHAGGWSQARYQRHIDMQDRRFAREAAEAIERLVDRVHARHLILAGEERTISVLKPELSPALSSMLESVEHIEMRAQPDEVAAGVAPILAGLRESEATDAAERVIAGVRAGGLGVAGMDPVAEALEAGQVHELVIDESAELDADLRSELVRLAARSAADVVVVRDHPGLSTLGGVGATLRYRADSAGG